ncbi:DUF3800 domain-containing protein [Blautia sp. An46]|uniref:DUF3800 domain-containing protein n=1 Tax=Blautia sp. An46 TaxID=1965636 RepID=UPI000B37B07A|nr:DUF3800 domain-containing protein [Blautia sp. An46]OUN89617.1 hypothetical protein B5G00_17795 [Blautia sp. An46]
MNTYLAYFDETGDDGITLSSSDHFILTSLYMPTEKWQSNFDKIKQLRRQLKKEYGFHISEEMHTKHFLTDKNPYRKYKWSKDEKREIIIAFTKMIGTLDVKIINVIIDKTKIKRDDYSILENALKYNIQRIENDSNGEWNYLIITDAGRIAPMRKTARAMRVYNPIQSQYAGYLNQPIKNMIEDIMEKDSSESYFIQLCDFISFFVHLYFVSHDRQKDLPKRVMNVIDKNFVGRVMATLKQSGRLNLKANEKNTYGLVIYPK